MNLAAREENRLMIRLFLLYTMLLACNIEDKWCTLNSLFREIKDKLFYRAHDNKSTMSEHALRVSIIKSRINVVREKEYVILLLALL